MSTGKILSILDVVVDVVDTSARNLRHDAAVLLRSLQSIRKDYDQDPDHGHRLLVGFTFYGGVSREIALVGEHLNQLFAAPKDIDSNYVERHDMFKRQGYPLMDTLCFSWRKLSKMRQEQRETADFDRIETAVFAFCHGWGDESPKLDEAFCTEQPDNHENLGIYLPDLDPKDAPNFAHLFMEEGDRELWKHLPPLLRGDRYMVRPLSQVPLTEGTGEHMYDVWLQNLSYAREMTTGKPSTISTSLPGQ